MKEFIDAFKHLEKLCNDIYGGQHGVTQYIEEMERTSPYLARKVFGWKEDYDSLKHVRHIRNAMVHDDSDYDTAYTFEDVQFLKNFYNRVMNQQDPLALLRKQNEAARAKNKAISEPTIPYKASGTSSGIPPEAEDETEWSPGKAVSVFFVAVVAIAIVVALCWMIFI